MTNITDTISQFWQDIASRPSGPLAMRFYLQPLMAMFFAVRDGLKDSATARPAYFWAIFSTPSHRRELLHNGWKSIQKVFMIAVALDVVYQFIVLHSLHILQAVFVATMLALVPYLVFRGPVNRIARRLRQGPSGRSSGTSRAA